MAYYAGFLETVNTRKTTVQIANIQMPAGGDAFYKNFIESKIAVDNCWTAGLLDCWTAGRYLAACQAWVNKNAKAWRLVRLEPAH